MKSDGTSRAAVAVPRAAPILEDDRFRLMVSLSIRIDLAPGIRVGPGKIRLLELIAEHGSISAAGRALAMSYRRAWLLVDEMNKTLSEPVIEAQPGGKAGGGARLTAFGERLVACYRVIEREAEEMADRHLSGLAATGEDR